jgi:dolichol-phosphate mannosyltransferase
LTESFVFLCIDDGSRDKSLEILQRLQQQLGNRIQIITRENKGHGQSCMEGYNWACQQKIPWVFQIDSDGQCDPQYFFRFWRLRDKYDVIYGIRTRRDDGWRRVIASWVLKSVLFSTQGVWCPDANVPYRLMTREVLAVEVEKIPRTFFLANIALAVLLKKSAVSHGYVPIAFRERYGGEPSVRLGKFTDKAVELVKQLAELPK